MQKEAVVHDSFIEQQLNKIAKTFEENLHGVEHNHNLKGAGNQIKKVGACYT